VEGRTISGQLRWIFSYWKEHNLSDKDKEYIDTEALRNKPQTVPDNPTRSFSV